MICPIGLDSWCNNTKAKKQTTRQENKLMRPQQIIDAALDVFISQGFKEARLEDIARGANVSKGLIYVYFPTKIDLFKAVAQAQLEALKAAKPAALSQTHQTAIEQLKALHDFFYDVVFNNENPC